MFNIQREIANPKWNISRTQERKKTRANLNVLYGLRGRSLDPTITIRLPKTSQATNKRASTRGLTTTVNKNVTILNESNGKYEKMINNNKAEMESGSDADNGSGSEDIDGSENELDDGYGVSDSEFELNVKKPTPKRKNKSKSKRKSKSKSGSKSRSKNKSLNNNNNNNNNNNDDIVTTTRMKNVVSREKAKEANMFGAASVIAGICFFVCSIFNYVLCFYLYYIFL